MTDLAEATVYRSRELAEAPDWVEVDAFKTFTVDQTTHPDGLFRLERSVSPSHFIIVLNGSVSVSSGTGRVTLNRRDWIAVPPDGLDIGVIRASHLFQAEILSVSGTWSDVNVCTIFQYRPERRLEMHFHDYNEYWFIYRGDFEGVYDGTPHRFVPGEMLAIPAGSEHGTERPLEGVIEGVGFSTTRVAQRRQGHLHRGEHGDPHILIDASGLLKEGVTQ